MFYEGDFFIFDTEGKHGDYFHSVELFGELIGWMSFPDHWDYEHTFAVVVPSDLDEDGIDTHIENATSLFENGEIVFDSFKSGFVYAEDVEPSLGGRYHGLRPSGDIASDKYADCLEIDADTFVYVLTLD